MQNGMNVLFLVRNFNVKFRALKRSLPRLFNNKIEFEWNKKNIARGVNRDLECLPQPEILVLFRDRNYKQVPLRRQASVFPVLFLSLQATMDSPIQNQYFKISSRCIHLTSIHHGKSYERSKARQSSQNNTEMVYYISAFVIFMLGVTYASVPLYKIYCQVAGIGGDPTAGHRTDLITTMQPVRERPIKVIFQADKHSYMKWKFAPVQNVIEVLPGETALAFYSAENPTDETIIGVATYNVLPYAAGIYFNKIQCFCFEQQWLNPHEKVELPVFFYIDPEFDNDPELGHVDEIVLSYTFFKAQEGIKIPLPGFMRSNKIETKVA